MRIVVNTPSGNIGHVVTDRLLQANEDVVIISRHPEKVAGFVAGGAHLAEGSIDDPQVLDKALTGADAFFWLTPPNYQPDFLDWSNQIAKTAADAIKSKGVKRAVVLSSIGAQNGLGSGPIGALLAVENLFKEAAPDVTILRAGFFMENFLNYVPTIAGAGKIFAPLPADVKVPMVATRDIGKKAAEILMDTSWNGFRVTGAHGPKDIDQIQAAQFVSEGIGRPVQYVELTVDQAKQAMIDAGMPDFAASLLGEMYTAIREGRVTPAEPRTAETTTETSLLEFSREVLKPAIGAAAASGQ
jgi:uncharacterized protein YbjT (DUF2867 family)